MKLTKLFMAVILIAMITVSCKETKKEKSGDDMIEATEESTDANHEATEESAEQNKEATPESVEVEKDKTAVEAVESSSKEVEEIAVANHVIVETMADTPVIYPGCTGGTADEIRACSVKKFRKFMSENFDADLANHLDLDKGEHKIRAFVKIDETGKASVLKADASKKALENELVRIIDKLPQMTPATKDGKPVSVSFVLPVTFKVENF